MPTAAEDGTCPWCMLIIGEGAPVKYSEGDHGFVLHPSCLPFWGPEPTTWATSGLDAISIQAMRNVAVLFPDGPVAETVRILDSRERRPWCTRSAGCNHVPDCEHGCLAAVDELTRLSQELED